MKEQKTKEQFIELRSQGLTFDKISQQLNTSKPTLMKWSKELSREISELEYIQFETLRAKYLMNKKSRIESYGEMIEKCKKELSSRELKDLSTDKLLNMIISLEDRFRKELEGVSCNSEEYISGLFLPSLDTPKYTWSLDE